MLDFLADFGAISIGVVIAAAVSTAWTRKPPAGRKSTDVWIDERDQVRFAGMWVAVDQYTNEIVSAASTADKVRADLQQTRPERQCHIIAVPGVASEPLRILLDV